VPLTLDDLAAHLNAPLPDVGDPRRAEWQRFLDTAVQDITRITGLLDATTATAQVSMLWEVVLPLPYQRLASIGTVTDPNGIVVTPWWSDPFAGIVRLYAGTPGVWSVVCTGTPWPAALQTAALEWAAHMEETQRVSLNPTASPDDQPPLPSFALPNRVAEFVNPYRLPGIA
jgi:hypothetical protein